MQMLQEFTFDEISNTLKEVRIRTWIGGNNTQSTGDNRDNPTLEAKETHDSESEIATAFKNGESPNHYADNFPKGGKRYFQEEQMRKYQEINESDSDRVGNGCVNDSYIEPNTNDSIYLNRRKLITKHLDSLRHKPPEKKSISTGELFSQGYMNHNRPSTSKRKESLISNKPFLKVGYVSL
ncbi:hypothetical protein O181_058535 [Austropuccinia psidii MF-1]|uniref:Uncharacterized protein n=1 Tax=Austropuccinia psidii MF-1 TaxID=1389203 RepID=A0A9Q3E9W4_9BASI|nr:hypothetical protein [Austropuccinia psidii MF-1]